MIFEEALKLMREGKKIRNPYFEEDEYLQACYVGLPAIFDCPADTFEEMKARGMSIVKMKGDRQHEDMAPKLSEYNPICGKSELHKYPQLNLFLIMRDDWEIVE